MPVTEQDHKPAKTSERRNKKVPNFAIRVDNWKFGRGVWIKKDYYWGIF